MCLAVDGSARVPRRYHYANNVCICALSVSIRSVYHSHDPRALRDELTSKNSQRVQLSKNAGRRFSENMFCL